MLVEGVEPPIHLQAVMNCARMLYAVRLLLTKLVLIQKPREILGLAKRLRIARRDTFLYEYVLPHLNETIAIPRNGETYKRVTAVDVRNETLIIVT
jgi:hypothetical protein